MATYNGWANRQTWLFALYYGDMLSEAIQAQEVSDRADLYSLAETFLLEEDNELETALEHLSGFVRDMVTNDMHLVDLDEIADTFIEELYTVQEY